MNELSLSDSLDTCPFAHTIDINLKTHLYKILDVVDTLYRLQKSDTNLHGQENYWYNDIVTLLKICAESLPK